MGFKKGYIMSKEHHSKLINSIKEQHKVNSNYGMKGKKHSEETKLKMSLASKGRSKSKEHKLNWEMSMKQLRNNGELIVWNKGLKKEDDGRVMKYSLKMKEQRKKQIFPKKDSTIEVKIQNFLKQLGLEFFTHQYIKEINHGYQCDILIPSMNIVIECDGDYWHKYPLGREIDHIRTRELLEKGFKVLRLWEYEIKTMNLNQFKERLK